MSTKNEEMLETNWKSMIGVRYSWHIGRDASMESQELSESTWFQTLGAVVVATKQAPTALTWQEAQLHELVTISWWAETWWMSQARLHLSMGAVGA